MNVELITKQDLENFKTELFKELREFSFPKKNNNNQRKWIKSYEVRKLLGISPGTLQNLRVNGTLPYTQVGGLMYYRFEDIQQLMNSNLNNKP